MQERIFPGTMTSKGQVTLPSEARKALGLDAAPKFIFRLVEGKLEILPLSRTFEQLCGSIPALREPLTEEEVERIAYEDAYSVEIGKEEQ